MLASLSQNTTLIPQCLSRISVLNTTRELLILPRSPSQQAEGPGERGLAGSPPCLCCRGQQAAPPPPRLPTSTLPSHRRRQWLRVSSAVHLPLTTDQRSAGGETNLLPTPRSRSRTVCAPRPVCPRLAQLHSKQTTVTKFSQTLNTSVYRSWHFGQPHALFLRPRCGNRQKSILLLGGELLNRNSRTYPGKLSVPGTSLEAPVLSESLNWHPDSPQHWFLNSVRTHPLGCSLRSATGGDDPARPPTGRRCTLPPARLSPTPGTTPSAGAPRQKRATGNLSSGAVTS